MTEIRRESRRTARAVAAGMMGILLAAATAYTGPSAGASVAAAKAPTHTATGPADSQPSPAGFSPFVEDWLGHGRSVTISKDGSFEASARVYVSCDQASPPCDKGIGGIVIDGYHASGRLTAVNGTSATGVVTDSNGGRDNWFPTGPITMTLNPATDSLSVAGNSFCGPNSPAGLCGA
ncbi:hypothetical protein AB0N06_18085 [Streptomyces sp. NPDC051020]|uniref:hypothetical protein n=1 Tax=Streptomyces sp. NPDC051020 TaxID=3155409 RepID=UPI003445924D